MTAAADLASRALALIKTGALPAAIALIEAASPEQQSDESVIRTHAIALAQTGMLDAALNIMQPVLLRSDVNAQSRALAARLFEDAKRWPQAFEQYAHIVRALPAQLAFWRGLWRVALGSESPTLVARANALVRELSPDFANDAPLSLAALRGRRRACATHAEIDDCLLLAKELAQHFPNNDEVRWVATQMATEAMPLRAAAWLQTLPAFALPTTTADALSAALAMPQLFESEQAIDAWRARYESGLRAFAALASEDANVSPSLMRNTAFSLAYQGRNNLSLQRLRGEALARCVAPRTPARAAREARANSDQRLRIGFVSKHIRDCTVGHYFRRFMTDLESEAIAVHLYPCGTTDAFTDDIAKRVTQRQNFALASNEDNDDATLDHIAKHIAADALDALIYPEIGMEPLIEKLAAMRLAPLQCALWGHPDTTGLPTVDVFFSAAAVEPETAQSHYCESLQLLPGLGCAYPRPPAPDAHDRASLGLPPSIPLLVCAQSSFKWRAPFVDAVAALLAAMPLAKLVYFRSRDNVAALAFDAYIEARFRAAKVSFDERVIAFEETTRGRFLAVLAACDLALDTFDFSGGNTTLDSLSVGLPVVTLPGEFMRSRQTMAMLRIVGADELIARDVSDYLRIASELTQDENKRRSLVETITKNADKLFDDERPVAALSAWLTAQLKQSSKKDS